MAEEGLAGQTNKANAAITPDVWNDFANSNEGTSFVAHGHLGASYDRSRTLGLHYIGAWSQDDRAKTRTARCRRPPTATWTSTPPICA